MQLGQCIEGVLPWRASCVCLAVSRLPMTRVVVDGMGLGTRGGCLVMSVPVDEEEEEEAWHRQPS